MRFFDRKKEIALLRDIQGLSEKTAQLTVLTGRRRIGKTALVLKAYENEPLVYFFVARKTEKELCADFSKALQSALGILLPGEISSFSALFEYVMHLSAERNITLFIDEFQDFYQVNPSIFSDMQKLWDLYKDKARINLIVGGSINSLMNRIFRDNKEPLYQRETNMIKLSPFTPSVLKEIMDSYSPGYDADDLLAMYAFTGGVAKYVELLIDKGAGTKSKMLDAIISEGSPFLDEGKIMLIGEFGKEYGTYFSILTAIARGRTTRAQIEETVGKEIGGYLSRLENDYSLIRKNQPIFEKTSNKNVRYALCDNFLIFWFRFLFKYNYMLEIKAFKQLRTKIDRDYDVFSGWMLERYFRELLIESEDFTRIGAWWDRKGENEIDIVAVNEIDKKMLVYEVKRNAEKINPQLLRRKTDVFISQEKHLANYDLSLKGLSLTDM